MAKVNFNYAVKLLRYDETAVLNTESVNSTISENTDVSKNSLQIKRSARLSKKYSLKKNSVIENDVPLNTKKQKKMICKKQKCSNVEPEKSIIPQKKETKRKKIQIPASVKSTKTNYPIEQSDPEEFFSSLNLIVNNEPIFVPNSLKNSETALILKDFVKTVENKDEATDKLKISNNAASDKFPIKKSSKSNFFKKKSSMINNINEDNTSNEHESRDKSISSKVSKKATSRSATYGKKKLPTNNLNNNDVSDNIENAINVVISQINQSETSKSTKNISEVKNLNLNSDNKSNELQRDNDIVLKKSSKIKTYPKSIAKIKKKAVINKNNATFTLGENQDLILPCQRGRPKKKNVELPETDGNVLKNDCYINRSKNLSVDLEDKKYCPKTDLSEKFEDDSVMLRNNNKPPRIKNKSCDEWSGDRSLSYSMLKSNNNVSSDDSKQNVNNCDIMFKNVLKTQKNPNRKIVQAKRKKKFNKNIENPDLIGSSITNTSEPQDLLTIKSTPIKPIGSGNDIISETVGIKTINNMPCIAETKSTSKVTVVPTVSTEISKIALTNDDELSSDKTISDPCYLPNSMITSELSYGMAILSEAISRQCRDSANRGIKRNSPEPDSNEMQSLKKTNNSLRSQVPSAIVSPQIVYNNMSKKVEKYIPEIYEKPVENILQSRVECEIFLLSKRFNIPIDSLKKTVVDEPLSVFHKKYSESVPPSMVTISPIVKDVETKSRLNVNYIGGNLDVEYKVEPIREGAAYEKSNLKDLMTELSKTMPSWSLSIVTNPSRYVISHMIIDVYGIPSANKCIVLDKNFRASVYINQCLEHTYCKQYTTATEIVNLIKELNSL